MSGIATGVPKPWIISRGQDLIWLQGSVLAGIALLGIFLLLPSLNSANYATAHPAVLVLFLWGILLDGTHVFGTYSRTYFAPDEGSRAALPNALAWSWLLLGPAIALIDMAVATPSVSLVGSAGWVFKSFLVFAYLWAYYHLIRQHYGIMVLYRRKQINKEQGNLDTYFLWVGSLYPYLRFSLTDSYLESGMLSAIPASFMPTGRLVLDAAFILVMSYLIVSWFNQRRKYNIALGPKHLFLLIVVSFHLMVFAFLDNLLVITAVLTIFHNLQYHRIVFLYEKGHNRLPMGTLFRYLGFGIFFGLLWYGPRILGVAALDNDVFRNILLGLGWGVAFHHYFVDARIWRVRKSPAVGQTLDRGAA